MTDSANVSIKFYPEKKGLEKFFGRLEAEIMETVWANGPLTVKRAQFFLGKKRKYAYTAVMTVMNRLAEKAYLLREKKGHSYQYSAAMEKKKFLTHITSEIISSLMHDFPPVTTRAFYNARKTVTRKAKSNKEIDE